MLTLATLGKYRFTSKPIPSEMTIVPSEEIMFCDGGLVVVPSKITRPSVYNHSGIMPKARNVLRKVIVMLRLRLPPSKTDHMLLAEPPGLQPKMKRPRRR